MKLLSSKIVFLFFMMSIQNFSFSQSALDYFNKGVAEFNYGNQVAALENLNKAIQLKPDYANALSYRAYINNQFKEYDKAIADYVAADNLTKNISGYLIANPFALKGKKDEAFKYLEASLTATKDKAQLINIINEPELNSLHDDPRWAALISKNWYTEYEILLNQAADFTTKRDADGTISTLTKAIQLDPKQATAYYKRGVVYFQTGSDEKALADLTQAISLDSKNSIYYSDRAYLYKEMKRTKEALADYDRAIELDPENMVYGDRAMARFALDQSDKRVESDLKTHLNSMYQDDFNWFLLGTYYFGIGSHTKAIEAFTKAIQLNDKTADFFSKRAQSYFELKQLDNAIADLNKAISFDPKECNYYYLRGTVRGEQMDKSGACQDWRKAISLGCEDYNGYVKAICN